MKVWVVYLLVATSNGPQYHDIGEAFRDKRACAERALAYAKAAMRSRDGNVLGATCAESRA